MFSQPLTRRRMIIDDANTRLCCPLSFCCSLEHTTVQDCDHPDKLQFIEPIHTRILRDIQYKVDELFREEHDPDYNQENDNTILSLWLNEIQQVYFREPMNEEQLHILLFRLKVPTILYWNATYDERRQLVLEAYRKIIFRFMNPVIIEENVFMNPLTTNSSIPTLEEDLLDLDMAFENEPFLIPDEDDDLLLNENSCKMPPCILYEDEPNEAMKEEECPICYEKGCHIRVINCTHNFCDCIITYMEKKNELHEISGCPCCRVVITKIGIYKKGKNE